MDAYETYQSHFPGNAFAAGEFEQSVLSAGREFLPPCAIAVLDGAEGTPEYWVWLTEQAIECERDAAIEAARERE